MKHLPFRIFTLAIFIVLIVPLLVQDGMFMDGVLYAAVAKNQAEGFGSFWQPIFAVPMAISVYPEKSQYN